jgi:hypothetical protein
MEIAKIITTESNGPKMIYISFDLWKTIIEFLNDDRAHGGFGSILTYRTINKIFSDAILECIGEVRMNHCSHESILKKLDVLLSRPLSLRKLVIDVREDEFNSGLTSNQKVKDICNLCKDAPMCKTLEVFQYSASLVQYYEVPSANQIDLRDRTNDNGLNSILDTFSNLIEINLQNVVVTIAAMETAQKLGKLNQLKFFRFENTKLFFDADLTVVDQWWQSILPYFPKSLEVIQLLDCEISYHAYDQYNDDQNILLHESIFGMLKSKFCNVLPNLRAVKITFKHKYHKDDDVAYRTMLMDGHFAMKMMVTIMIMTMMIIAMMVVTKLILILIIAIDSIIEC